MGVIKGDTRSLDGFYRDNGKENGNYRNYGQTQP